MTPEIKTKFKAIVHKEIVSRNDTNMDIGLEDGFEVLLSRKFVDDVTSMFLLSDRKDTCSNTFPSFEKTSSIKTNR